MERIVGKSNEKIKLAAALRADSSRRREEGLFVLEGTRLCSDAVRSGVVVQTAFVTDAALSRDGGLVREVIRDAKEAYIIDGALCARISDTKTPQGIFCICKMLDKTPNISKIDINGKYLALERVSDPSNLGAAARSAEAFGLNGIITGSGCDIYNPKAQRAAMGSLLRLPVFPSDDLPELLASLGKAGMKTFASVVHSEAQDLIATDFSGGCVCAVGNEGSGLSPEATDACAFKITITMKGRAESLNAAAAAAVIMWEMMK